MEHTPEITSRYPRIHSNKGFTVVEMAIVMIIVGILVALGVSMIGPLVRTAKVNETKATIDADIESLAGFAATNRRLPGINAVPPSTIPEYKTVFSKSNDAWGNPLYYIVDGSLTGTADAICGRRSTSITVRNCLTDDCATTAGTDYVDISNIAFLLISGGDNFNVQTASVAGRVTVYVRNGATTRDNCTTVGNCPNYSGTMINQTERYDDIVKWITLEELRTKTGCAGQQLRVVNNELPVGNVTNTYSATVYGDAGVPYGAGGSYRWCVQTITGTLATDLPGFTATPNVASVNCQGLAEASWGQANSLQISKIAGASTAGSYKITVYIRDNADTGGGNDNIAYRTFVITVSP